MNKFLVLPILLAIVACNPRLPQVSSGICSVLPIVVEDLADAILDNAERTPEDVITTGTTVVKVSDEGCSDN